MTTITVDDNVLWFLGALVTLALCVVPWIGYSYGRRERPGADGEMWAVGTVIFGFASALVALGHLIVLITESIKVS